MARCSSITAFLVCSLLPAASPADGTLALAGGSYDLAATAQRALLWQREGIWEIHILPVFPRAAGAAGWVVPFPVRPQVSESSAVLFEQLELLTAPVFFHVCRPVCTGLCDGGSEVLVRGAGAGVKIWERGQIGPLSFAVISSADGESLYDWLHAEDFRFSPGAGPILAELTGEGSFFFVARLSGELDPAAPLVPLRFVLPGLKDPIYPIRLTRLSVAARSTLDLTLWLVVDSEVTYAARGFETRRLESDLYGIDEYRLALTEALTAADRPRLAELYSRPLYDEDRFRGSVCSTDPTLPCASLSVVGLTAPKVWTSEISEIASSTHRLFRFQTRLTPENMRTDLTFEPTEEPASEIHNVFAVEVNTCNHFPSQGCGLGGGVGLFGALVLSLALGLGLRRRR